MDTVAEKRICLRREGGMPEGATIPRDPPLLNERQTRMTIGAVALVAGYVIALLVPRYEYLKGPGALVTRVSELTGRVEYCLINKPCMTAEERLEEERAEADRAARERAAMDADAADATAYASIDDATVMAERPAAPLDLSGLKRLPAAAGDGGRDLFEEAGIKPDAVRR